MAEEASDVLRIPAGRGSKELLPLVGPGLGSGTAPRGACCLLLRGGPPTVSTSKGLSSGPRDGLTAFLIPEATWLAGGLLLTSLHRLGDLLLGLYFLHQLCGRLECAGALGETSSHPLGFERVHLGGWQDVVLSGLSGLGLGTEALGTACHVVELPVLGGSVNLSHLLQYTGLVQVGRLGSSEHLMFQLHSLGLEVRSEGGSGRCQAGLSPLPGELLLDSPWGPWRWFRAW